MPLPFGRVADHAIGEHAQAEEIGARRVQGQVRQLRVMHDADLHVRSPVFGDVAVFIGQVRSDGLAVDFAPGVQGRCHPRARADVIALFVGHAKTPLVQAQVQRTIHRITAIVDGPWRARCLCAQKGIQTCLRIRLNRSPLTIRVAHTQVAGHVHSAPLATMQYPGIARFERPTPQTDLGALDVARSLGDHVDHA